MFTLRIIHLNTKAETMQRDSCVKTTLQSKKKGTNYTSGLCLFIIHAAGQAVLEYQIPHPFLLD